MTGVRTLEPDPHKGGYKATQNAKLEEVPHLVRVHVVVHDRAGQIERNRNNRAENRVSDVLAMVQFFVCFLNLRIVHSGFRTSKKMFVPVGSETTLQSSRDACCGANAANWFASR